MQCLLQRTTERNGRLCDDTTDEAVTELAHCEEIQTTGSVDHLRIVYHVIPDFHYFCLFCLSPPWEVIPAIHPFPGRCISVPPARPCTEALLAQEYEELWALPQPDFLISSE